MVGRWGQRFDGDIEMVARWGSDRSDGRSNRDIEIEDVYYIFLSKALHGSLAPATNSMSPLSLV